MEYAAMPGRSPHGERGLKCAPSAGMWTYRSSRSPHGERGLKSKKVAESTWTNEVAPHTGSVD